MTDWQRIRNDDFALPAGGSVPDLVGELVEMLASPDPDVRDGIAFPALATWVDEGVVPDEELVPLGDSMAKRFEDERIWARTFAPLVLAVIVARRGVVEPGWVDAFEDWYAAETDLRGHDADLGWLHAVAHGADLLGELGVRPEVSARRMLDLAGARLLTPVDEVWHDQEHDRLAHAVGTVLTRPGLTREDALGWLDPVAELLASGAPGRVPAHVSNTLHTLRMLYLLADRDVRVAPDEVRPVVWRQDVLDRLAEVLHPATPWMW